LASWAGRPTRHGKPYLRYFTLTPSKRRKPSGSIRMSTTFFVVG
jgi:hypothetical protein